MNCLTFLIIQHRIIEKNISFNKDGCWDGLIQWINKSVELKMLKDFPNTLFVDNSIKNIIEKIKDNDFDIKGFKATFKDFSEYKTMLNNLLKIQVNSSMNKLLKKSIGLMNQKWVFQENLLSQLV